MKWRLLILLLPFLVVACDVSEYETKTPTRTATRSVQFVSAPLDSAAVVTETSTPTLTPIPLPNPSATPVIEKGAENLNPQFTGEDDSPVGDWRYLK